MNEDKGLSVLNEYEISDEIKGDITKSYSKFLDGLPEMLLRGNEITVDSVDQTNEMKEAKKLRLALVKKRTGLDGARKEIKEPYLRAEKAIDGVAKSLKDTIQETEAHLKYQEEFAKRLEEEKLDAMEQDRIKILSEFDEMTGIVNNIDLRKIPEDEFQQIVENMKESRRMAIESAEREAKERGEREAREKKQQDEIDQLKKDADELAAKQKIESDAREAEAKEAQDALDAEMEELRKANAKLEQDRLDKEAADKSIADAAQKVIDDEAEAVRIAEEAAEQAKRAAELAPDKEKLKDYAEMLLDLDTPDLDSQEANNILNTAYQTIQAVASGLKSKARNLF